MGGVAPGSVALETQLGTPLFQRLPKKLILTAAGEVLIGHIRQTLKELSRAQQVLCVTHLPQIAAFADQHFLVEKRERQGTTKTSVRLLDDEERTEEVARMLSGAKLTETSLRHAEQMLKTSRGASKPKV